MEMKEEEVQISIPHVTQKHTWDCGLACAQMILRYGLIHTQGKLSLLLILNLYINLTYFIICILLVLSNRLVPMTSLG